MRASAQQQESCVSILSALPSPLEAKPPDSRQFHDCVLPPPPQFFFFSFFLRIVGLRGHGGEWETGYCISFADGLFSFSGDSWIGLTSLITASLLIVCQLAALVTSEPLQREDNCSNNDSQSSGLYSIRTKLNTAFIPNSDYHSLPEP